MSIRVRRRCLFPALQAEGVIVCDRYHDFLRNTLPYNKYLFDKLVVVTSYEDKETQRVCEFNHVECIRTDVMESRKGHFRKGMGINVGLAALSREAWVVHLDADILLPPQTRILLERAELDAGMFFGIDRFIVRGYRAWEKFREELPLQHECDSYVHLNAFPLGTRVMNAAEGGFVPIGFFQMWNPAVSGVHRYPEGHTTAGRRICCSRPHGRGTGGASSRRSWDTTWRVRTRRWPATGTDGRRGRFRGVERLAEGFWGDLRRAAGPDDCGPAFNAPGG